MWAAGVIAMVLAGLAGLEVFLAKQPYGYDLWAYERDLQALVAALALSWLLLQVVGERNDLVPIAAHLLGLVVLLAVALAALVVARGTVGERVTARATA